MAGNPQYQTFSAKIATAGEEVILDRIANGDFVTVIAKDLGVSPAMIYKWIHETPEREAAWAEAKEVSSHTHVEGGLERLTRLADSGAGATSAQVSAEKALAEYRWKLAAARNKKDYGDKAGVEVAFNFNLGHLEALKELGNMGDAPAKLEQHVEEADFEVIEQEAS